PTSVSVTLPSPLPERTHVVGQPEGDRLPRLQARLPVKSEVVPLAGPVGQTRDHAACLTVDRHFHLNAAVRVTLVAGTPRGGGRLQGVDLTYGPRDPGGVQVGLGVRLDEGDRGIALR